MSTPSLHITHHTSYITPRCVMPPPLGPHLYSPETVPVRVAISTPRPPDGKASPPILFSSLLFFFSSFFFPHILISAHEASCHFCFLELLISFPHPSYWLSGLIDFSGAWWHGLGENPTYPLHPFTLVAHLGNLLAQ